MKTAGGLTGHAVRKTEAVATKIYQQIAKNNDKFLPSDNWNKKDRALVNEAALNQAFAQKILAGSNSNNVQKKNNKRKRKPKSTARAREESLGNNKKDKKENYDGRRGRDNNRNHGKSESTSSKVLTTTDIEVNNAKLKNPKVTAKTLWKIKQNDLKLVKNLMENSEAMYSPP